MPLFRNKMFEIEARRFETNTDDGTCMRELCEWIEESEEPIQVSHDGISIKIATLEGVLEAVVGDWIIKAYGGLFYPCNPRVFKATYEII